MTSPGSINSKSMAKANFTRYLLSFPYYVVNYCYTMFTRLKNAY